MGWGGFDELEFSRHGDRVFMVRLPAGEYRFTDPA